MPEAFVYILSSKKNGTLYCGVTKNFARRIFEHRHDIVPGFTSKYKVHSLVYYERYEALENAIHREKCIKAWKRQWKIDLIEKSNPDWNDLYDQIA